MSLNFWIAYITLNKVNSSGRLYWKQINPHYKAISPTSRWLTLVLGMLAPFLMNRFMCYY